MTNYLIYHFGMMIVGLIFFGPRAIEESYDPWFSLWLDWAEQHKDNDFEAVWYDWDCTNHHPVNWYDEEFEQWLYEQGYDPWTKDNSTALFKLQKYLIKKKYVKRQCYWNHYVYQINSKKLF